MKLDRKQNSQTFCQLDRDNDFQTFFDSIEMKSIKLLFLNSIKIRLLKRFLNLFEIQNLKHFVSSTKTNILKLFWKRTRSNFSRLHQPDRNQNSEAVFEIRSISILSNVCFHLTEVKNFKHFFQVNRDQNSQSCFSKLDRGRNSLSFLEIRSRWNFSNFFNSLEVKFSKIFLARSRQKFSNICRNPIELKILKHVKIWKLDQVERTHTAKS